MSRARGHRVFLAALCVSAAAMVSASAQETPAGGHVPQGEAAVTPNLEDGSKPGWLLRGPGQNRIVNPFRATPAPGLPPRAATRGQRVPENATANAIGPGWTCNTGFRQQDSTCVPVRMPANAALDFSGHDWMCNPGFVRQGQRCVAFTVPQNASLGALGRGWACNPGFRRQGASCVAIAVPEHASLDKTGRNWVCDSGYQRRDQGCIDDATARLQQQADKAVNAPASGKVAPRPSVTVNSGEDRLGRTSKAKVVIGRF